MTTRAAAIGHLGADCCYISAERMRAEVREGQPVGVLGNQTAGPEPRPSDDAVRTWLGICRRDILVTPTSE